MKNNMIIEEKADMTEPEITFRKVMRGYNPEEVTEYIEEMSSAMRDASKNYEVRMSEMNQELTLVSRERSSLNEKCADLESKLRATVALLKEKVEEESKYGGVDALKASVDELEKKLAEEREISENLKAGLSAAEKKALNLETILSEKESEIMAAEAAGDEVERLGVLLESKEKELEESLEALKSYKMITDRQETLQEQYDGLLGEFEELKAHAESLNDEKEHLIAEGKAVGEKILSMEKDQAALRSELNRLTVENSLLSDKNEQYKNEISALRSDAKSKEYAHAERLSEEKASMEQERLTFRKKLQLQEFYIDQADTAIEELKNQLKHIRDSFSE